MRECDIYLVIDHDGYYEVGTTIESAGNNYENEVANLSGQITRTIHIKLDVELPTPAELTGTAPLPNIKATLISAS